VLALEQFTARNDLAVTVGGCLAPAHLVEDRLKMAVHKALEAEAVTDSPT
jgi:hypothetical protein